MANNTNWMLVLGIGVLAYFLLSGSNPFGGTTPPSGGSTGGDTTINVPPIDVVCDSGTSPSPTFNTLDKLTGGTAITGETAIYAKKNGALAWTVFQPPTAISNLEVGETYYVAFGINTSNMGNFSYGPLLEQLMPCKESFSKNVELYADANLTTTFFNSDDTASTAQAMTASDSPVIRFKVRPASPLHVFGNPYIKDTAGVTGTTGGSVANPDVACFDYNDTSVDAPLHLTQEGGSELAAVSVPQRHSMNSQVLSVAGLLPNTKTKCFEFPVVNDETLYFTLQLKSSATDEAVGTGSIVGYYATFYPSTWFENADDGKLYWGVEDEAGNGVFYNAVGSPPQLNITIS